MLCFFPFSRSFMSSHFLDYCDNFGCSFGTFRLLLFHYFLEIRSNIFISVYIIIITASYSFYFQSFTCDLSMLSDSCIAYYSMVISNCRPKEILSTLPFFPSLKYSWSFEKSVSNLPLHLSQFATHTVSSMGSRHHQKYKDVK